jgi:transcriptional regulator
VSDLTLTSRSTYRHIDFDMTQTRSNQMRGTLDLLILKSLDAEALHGVGIVRRIEQITAGALQISFGSLFPALHRMERAGWLSADWQPSPAGRHAKYYALTRRGRVQLRHEETAWENVVKAIAAALRST